MANYVPTMPKEDLEKYGKDTIGTVSTYAELEEVEERLKELV